MMLIECFLIFQFYIFKTTTIIHHNNIIPQNIDNVNRYIDSALSNKNPEK